MGSHGPDLQPLRVVQSHRHARLAALLDLEGPAPLAAAASPGRPRWLGTDPSCDGGPLHRETPVAGAGELNEEIGAKGREAAALLRREGLPAVETHQRGIGAVHGAIGPEQQPLAKAEVSGAHFSSRRCHGDHVTSGVQLQHSLGIGLADPLERLGRQPQIPGQHQWLQRCFQRGLGRSWGWGWGGQSPGWRLAVISLLGGRIGWQLGKPGEIHGQERMVGDVKKWHGCGRTVLFIQGALG